MRTRMAEHTGLDPGLPAEDLARDVRLRLAVGPLEDAITMDGRPMGTMIPAASLFKYRRGGIPIYTAGRICGRLGIHPAAVWGWEFYADLLEDIWGWDLEECPGIA